MKSAYQLAAEFRLTLLTRDKVARDQLLAAYQNSFRAVDDEIRRVAERIVISKGGPTLFAEQRRLHELQRQVAEAIKRLSTEAANLAKYNQYLAVTSARHEAVELIAAKAVKLTKTAQIDVSFNTFPAQVVEELVGFSAKAPITEVFDELARDLGQITTQRIKHALQRGVTLGESPERVTRRIIREASQTGGNPRRPPVVVRRLQLVVRNETFRAYRKATLETYRENDDVVRRWRWVSRQSPTTCIVCWSQDGKTFPLSTPFASHPGCRCVETPVLHGENETYKTGPEKFDELEPGVQRSILGDKAYEVWSNNDDVQIADFVELQTSRRWGPSRVRRSIDQVLGKRKTA